MPGFFTRASQNNARMQKGLGKARVPAARKLGIRLWIMGRDQIEYSEMFNGQ